MRDAAGREWKGDDKNGVCEVVGNVVPSEEERDQGEGGGRERGQTVKQ